MEYEISFTVVPIYSTTCSINYFYNPSFSYFYNIKFNIYIYIIYITCIILNYYLY